jgi:hypothetical protein
MVFDVLRAELFVEIIKEIPFELQKKAHIKSKTCFLLIMQKNIGFMTKTLNFLTILSVLKQNTKNVEGFSLFTVEFL